MKSRILLVEDDSTLSMIVAETLQRDGFDVVTAADGEDGLRQFARRGADLIIADVMMPRMDGFEMARRIRQVDRRVPLLFLTARAEIDDIVEGFELGGNDYLKKPFRMLELIVRIKALLRRNADTAPEGGVIGEGGEGVERGERGLGDERLAIGDYTLDLSTQTLTHATGPCIELTLIEAKLLGALIANAGHTVDASTMMQLIWQRDDPYSRNSLHGFIHKLRHYLRHDPTLTLINQRGIGYKLTVRRR